MESNVTEYACSQKNEGKWLIYKLLLLLLYATYTIVYLYVIVKIGFVPLGALIPITLWIMIYFTWRYTSPDYKYTIDAGDLTFYVSYGKKTHKKFKAHIKDVIAIAPREKIREHLNGIKPKKIYNALSSKHESDAYAIVFKKETKVCIFYLKATRDTVKALHYYNKNTVIQPSEDSL